LEKEETPGIDRGTGKDLVYNVERCKVKKSRRSKDPVPEAAVLEFRN
jgi:hypothetical protein